MVCSSTSADFIPLPAFILPHTFYKLFHSVHSLFWSNHTSALPLLPALFLLSPYEASPTSSLDFTPISPFLLPHTLYKLFHLVHSLFCRITLQPFLCQPRCFFSHPTKQTRPLRWISPLYLPSYYRAPCVDFLTRFPFALVDPRRRSPFLLRNS